MVIGCNMRLVVSGTIPLIDCEKISAGQYWKKCFVRSFGTWIYCLYFCRILTLWQSIICLFINPAHKCQKLVHQKRPSSSTVWNLKLFFSIYVNRGHVSEGSKIIPTSGHCKIIHLDESESRLPGISHICPTPKNIVLRCEYVKAWRRREFIFTKDHSVT